MDEVYALFNNAVPDYTAGSPGLTSVHKTFLGAVQASFAKEVAQWRRTQIPGVETWYGPDGFGMIRRMEVQEGTVFNTYTGHVYFKILAVTEDEAREILAKCVSDGAQAQITDSGIQLEGSEIG